MPSTINANKILANRRSLEGRDNRRVSALVHYVTQALSSKMYSGGRLKCVAKRLYGFSDSYLENTDVIEEFKYDILMRKSHGRELISHWVISFSEDMPYLPGKLLDISRDFMAGLGYTEDHKQLLALHVDTDNLHVHVVACRVHQLTGLVLREGNGWYKRESHRLLAQLAYKHGLAVVANNLYEIKESGYGPRQVEAGIRKQGRPLNQKAKRAMIYGKGASEQQKLQLLLTEFLRVNADSFARWGMGDFHSALAELGIECHRKEVNAGKYGIIFSLDSKRFCKASTVCPDLTYKGIMAKIGAKKWSDPEQKIRAMLDKARSGDLCAKAAPQSLSDEGTALNYVAHGQELPSYIPHANRLRLNYKRRYFYQWRNVGSLSGKPTTAIDLFVNVITSLRLRILELLDPPARDRHSQILYKAHYGPTAKMLGHKQHTQKDINLLIALRLRTTGHSEIQIRNILYNGLYQYAHDKTLGIYVRSIARQAIRDKADFSKYKTKWLILEKYAMHPLLFYSAKAQIYNEDDAYAWQKTSIPKEIIGGRRNVKPRCVSGLGRKM